MSRQDNQSPHEKWWRGVHPKVKAFFTSAVASYVDTSARQNYIGAEANAFQTLMLPLYEWKGPGEVVLRQMMMGAPQVYVQQTPIITGIAGIQSGQSWQAALIDSPAQGADIV